MEIVINRTKSRTGKRILFFGTINGKRIGKTNWAVKWEAKRELEHALEFLYKKYGKEETEKMFKN